MRLSNSPLARFNRLLLTLMLTLAWTGVAGVTGRAALAADEKAQAADPTPQTLRETADDLAKLLKFYDAIDHLLPRDTFDLNAVIQQTGNDADKIFGWVRDNTAYVPYRGILRGPAGVLMDRAGNSLDRAILLGRLLQLAGQSVRLARGQLTDTQAAQLLQKLWIDPKSVPAPKPADGDSIERTFEALIKEQQLDPGQFRRGLAEQQLKSQQMLEELVGLFTSQSDRLAAMVAAPAAKSDAEQKRQQAAVAEHWWVQRQESGRWIDLDLDSSDGKAGSALTPMLESIELLPDSLVADASLFHELEVRVMVERRDGNKIDRRPALKQVLRPALLAGQSAWLGINPMDWPGNLNPLAPDAPEKFKAALSKVKEWLPVMRLSGGQQIVQGSFDENGAVNEKPKLDSIARLGGGVTEKIGGVLGAFGADEPAKPSGVLSGVSVEFEIRSPREEPRVIRRDIYDAIGPARRLAPQPGEPALDDAAKFARSVALSRLIGFLPVGCTLSDEFVTHALLRNLIENGPSLQSALRSANELKKSTDALSEIHPLPAPTLSLAALRRGPPGINASMVVDRLNLFALHETIAASNAGVLHSIRTVDILANEQAVRAKSGPEAFAARLRQGILETQIEAIAHTGKITGRNTAAIWSASQGQKIAWIALKNEADLAELKLDADSAARISSDVKAGYVIVAPTAPVLIDGTPHVGWWRVDPNRGDCIGFIGDGMGASEVEYMAITFAITNGLYTFAGCGGAAPDASPTKRVGCLVCGVAAGVVTYFSCLNAVGGVKAGLAGLAGGAQGFYGGQVLGALCNSWSAAKQ